MPDVILSDTIGQLLSSMNKKNRKFPQTNAYIMDFFKALLKL